MESLPATSARGDFRGRNELLSTIERFRQANSAMNNFESLFNRYLLQRINNLTDYLEFQERELRNAQNDLRIARLRTARARLENQQSNSSFIKEYEEKEFLKRDGQFRAALVDFSAHRNAIILGTGSRFPPADRAHILDELDAEQRFLEDRIMNNADDWSIASRDLDREFADEQKEISNAKKLIRRSIQLNKIQRVQDEMYQSSDRNSRARRHETTADDDADKTLVESDANGSWLEEEDEEEDEEDEEDEEEDHIGTSSLRDQLYSAINTGDNEVVSSRSKGNTQADAIVVDESDTESTSAEPDTDTFNDDNKENRPVIYTPPLSPTDTSFRNRTLSNRLFLADDRKPGLGIQRGHVREPLGTLFDNLDRYDSANSDRNRRASRTSVTSRKRKADTEEEQLAGERTSLSSADAKSTRQKRARW